MKITASHSLKLPVPGVEYGSMGASVSIEGEPPPDIQGDQQKLMEYVRRLLQEAKTRTEEHLAQQGNGAQNGPRTPQNGATRRPHRPMRGPNGRSNGNGENGRSLASLKQINYIRSLGRDAGMSEDDLAYLAEERCGTRDMRSLSRRGASTLIEELQGRSSRRA